MFDKWQNVSTFDVYEFLVDGLCVFLKFFNFKKQMGQKSSQFTDEELNDYQVI